MQRGPDTMQSPQLGEATEPSNQSQSGCPAGLDMGQQREPDRGCGGKLEEARGDHVEWVGCLLAVIG